MTTQITLGVPDTTPSANVFVFHPEYKIAVHQSHCCARHGCKYADSPCPVSSGEYEQAYPCEYCTDPKELKEELDDKVAEYRWSLQIYRLSASRTYD